MATTFPILGQAAPTTSGDVSLVGSRSGYAVVSTVTVANRSASATDYFYIRVVSGADSPSDKQYVAYKAAVAPSSFVTLSLGITLGANDTLWVKCDNATCSFNAFGTVVS